MDKLYDQMSFVLSGGALQMLVDFLAPRVESALIACPKGEDLDILDALGVRTDELVLHGRAGELASVFPNRPLTEKFELTQAQMDAEIFDVQWKWVIRIRGRLWSVYILLQNRADGALLMEISQTAGLVALWQTHLQVEAMEDRLSRLSYTILATKSTLASVFEPMPIDSCVAFFTDVLRESLFPLSVTIFKDNGSELVFLKGDDNTPPLREGFYTQVYLPPTPVFTHNTKELREIVIPLVEPYRLFCVTKWGSVPTEETLNFMELLGNIAQRALSIQYLRLESGKEQKQINADEFLLFSLTKARGLLNAQKNIEDLLNLGISTFAEFAVICKCFLVAWDDNAFAYAPVAYHDASLASQFEPNILVAHSMFQGDGELLTDLKNTDFSDFLNGHVSPWPEMSGMRYLFPFWDGESLEGFIAMSDDDISDNRLAALQILAQFIANGLKKFLA
ncbi:hypothetical protein AGMMS50276_06460 [Synergistales bacterium]|nr:hypothetical protein AGMMS50276_06460 [Synergistales bacterium]